MPDSPTANMALVLPTDHSDTDVWGALLADVFALIDAHDHTAGKGVKVPAAALRINADLPFSDAGAYYAATSLKAADFQPVNPSDVAGYAGALFVSNVDNNLYWRTTAGANVKVTDGTTLNVAGFTGGIGGDYASVGALLSFTDSIDSYSLLQQDPGGGRPWARLRTGDVDIYQTAAGITNRVRIQSPAALAASYALTLPGAAPASTQIVQVTSGGVMSFSNTIAENLAMAAGKTITLSGDITFTSAGKVNHAEKMIGVAHELLQFGATGTWSLTTPDTLTGQSLGTFSTSGGYGYIDVQGLKPGDRPTKVIVAYTATGGGPNIAGYRGTWNGGFAWSTTPGAAVTVGGIKYATYTVDTPVALGTFDPGGGILAMSERLRLRIGALSNTTVIYGITLAYDSIDTPTYLT
jgi:hypothetical protein